MEFEDQNESIVLPTGNTFSFMEQRSVRIDSNF